MAIEIRLSALAPSMTEGAVARWVKKEGEVVKAGDFIAEIETDKALVDLEAPADGVLGKILVADGTLGVKVDTIIGWLLQPGESVPPSSTPVLDVKAAPTGPVRAAAAAPSSTAASTFQARQPGARIFASPLARRLAGSAGLALDAIRGSGPHGRIVRVDVETALNKPQAATIAATTPLGAYDETPHSTTRRVIAQRLTEAKQQIPHFYLSIDCQIDSLLALRAEVNASRDDVKLSVNDFVIRACAVALRQVSAVNVSWTESATRRYHDVDISVAVTTPFGLITPVLRGADRKTVSMISVEVKELAGRAREGRLKPQEYQGGGLTVSNLGMYGIREFAAIINPPQACILAVGAGEQRPVVRDGALAVATVMTLTLSVDHRVVDGAVAAEFLAVLGKLLESPLGMLV